MYRKILIATDGSELAGRALAQGLDLAKSLGASLAIVTVSDIYPTASGSLFPRPDDLERYESGAASAAHTILATAAGVAAAAGVPASTHHVPDKSPAEGILQVCDAERCDLIVMATHGRRGLDRILLGSQAARVMSASRVSVLVAR